MISMIFLALQVRFTIMANRLMHFFRLRNAYGNYGLKMGITIIGALFVINKKTMMHLIYVVVLAALGIGLNQLAVHGGIFETLRTDGTFFDGITAADVIQNAFVSWFIISIVGAPLLSISVSGMNNANDNMMVNYLRADPAVYVKSRLLTDITGGILLYIPTFALAFAVLAGTVATWAFATVTVLVIFLAARIMGEAVNMWMFKRFHKHFGHMGLSIVVVIPVYATSILVPYYLSTPNVVAVLTNPIAIILPILIGAFAFAYIKKYTLYMQLINDKITCYEAYYAKAAAKTEGQSTVVGAIDVKNWSKGLKTENLEIDKHTHKKGFDYLNAIFFDRHSRFFKKKMTLRCLILLSPLVAVAVIAAYSFITTGEPPLGLFQPASPYAMPRSLTAVLGYSSVILFIIYIASMGRVVTASVFSNCDVQMMYYPYYRKAKTILASFKARFAVIVRYNFIISAVMFVSLVGATALFFGYLEWFYVVMLFVALFCTGLFFAFNDLFLYYVIQPYDSEGKDKSMPNKIINWIIYGVSWACFYFFHLSLVTYTIAIAIATVLYVGAGMVLLLKFAPSRFRLR